MKVETSDMANGVIRLSSEYVVLNNINYLRANGIDLMLDIYVPIGHIDYLTGDVKKSIDKKIPVVIFFHGGGWVEGSKEQSVLQLLYYMEKGWGVVNVEYRMAGDALAPAAVEDARCATWWVKRNSEKYGFNPKKIILAGQSAGGHLALLAGILPGDAGFDTRSPEAVEPDSILRRANVAFPDLEVAAIINWAGITDLECLVKEPNLRGYAITWLGAQKNIESLAKRLSPLTYIRENLPPIITIHGANDVVVPHEQAKRLHDSLNGFGNINQLYTVEGKEHFDFSFDDWVGAYAAVDRFIFQVLKD